MEFSKAEHHFFTEHFMKEYRKVIFVERVVSRIPNFSEIIRIIFNRKKKIYLIKDWKMLCM